MNDTRQIAADIVNRRKNPDADRVKDLQRRSLDMLTIAHRGLSAIKKGEISEVGARSMANLAAEALEEMEKIAGETI